MSKRIRLVLSVCILALCLSTLTFGVLAAVQKSNQIKGEIGFNADNCDVSISGVVTGAVKTDGSANNASFPTSIVTNDTRAWQINDVLCFDESNYPEIPDIVITFTVTNNSSTVAVKVTATLGSAIPTDHVSATFSSNVGTWSDTDGITLGTKGGTEPSSATITLTISLTDKINTLPATQGRLVNFKFETPTNS